MEISVYQLTTTTVDKALPKLLEKIYEQGKRCHIITNSEEQCRVLNASLWTYSTLAFLPHGCIFDADLNPKDQPIWLSTTADIQNDAVIMISLQPEFNKSYEAMERMVYLYDIYADTKPAFDTLLKHLNDSQVVTVWQQQPDGAWKKS